MIQKARTMISIIKMGVFKFLELMIIGRITWDRTRVIGKGKSSSLSLAITPSTALSLLKWSQTPAHLS